MSKKKKKEKAPDKPTKKSKKKEKKLSLPITPREPLSFARSLGLTDPLKVTRVDMLAQKLGAIETYKDIGHATFLLNELHAEVNSSLKDGSFDDLVTKDFSYVGLQDIYGYRPFSSQFSGLFPGPWGVFTYIASNYWAVLDCRNILYREILADGYRLVGGNKEERARAKEVCTALNMKELRAQISDHLKTFGNVFFLPIKNGIKGIKEFKPLLPQYIRPIPTIDGQNIKEWQVQKGAWYYTYKRDDLLRAQFRPCLKNYDVGDPPLGAVLVDIEADLCASSLNNTFMQKGGLFGIAVLLESGANAGGKGRGVGPTAYAQYLQAALSANHSGSRSGLETVVFENTKSVEVLNKLSEMDGCFQRSGDGTAKKTAHCYGIPHEMIGIITNANQQYHPSAMMDYSAKQLDKTIAEVLNITDTFINKKIFPLVGIKNVRVKASPRYNSTTRTATQAGTDLASMYNVLTIDEYRTEWLGRPPLPNGEGRKALSKLILDSGVKGAGESGAGARPSQVIIPPEMPKIEIDSEEFNDIETEGEDD